VHRIGIHGIAAVLGCDRGLHLGRDRGGLEQQLSLVHDQLCRLLREVKHDRPVLVVVVGHVAAWVPVRRAICVRVRGPVAVVVDQVVLACPVARPSRT